MISKIRLRRAVSALLDACGVHALLERFRLADGAFVLMYHRIVPSAERQSQTLQAGMMVTVATFEKQLDYLSRRFRVVFFDDLVAKVGRGEPIGGYCALTFDDGWRDNYSEAFPLLKKYGVPATIFLSTGFIGTRRRFWFDEASCLLSQLDLKPRPNDGLPAQVAQFFETIYASGATDLEALRDEAIELLKKLSPHRRELILRHLRIASGNVELNSSEEMLNWEEVQEMADSALVRFGAHTVNHELLDRLTLQSARQEICLSRSEIECRLGQKVTSFAYPNGNYNESVRQIVKEAGFDAAATIYKGFLRHGMCTLEIPRIALHEDVSATIPMLRSRILLQHPNKRINIE